MPALVHAPLAIRHSRNASLCLLLRWHERWDAGSDRTSSAGVGTFLHHLASLLQPGRPQGGSEMAERKRRRLREEDSQDRGAHLVGLWQVGADELRASQQRWRHLALRKCNCTGSTHLALKPLLPARWTLVRRWRLRTVGITAETNCSPAAKGSSLVSCKEPWRHRGCKHDQPRQQVEAPLSERKEVNHSSDEQWGRDQQDQEWPCRAARPCKQEAPWQDRLATQHQGPTKPGRKKGWGQEEVAPSVAAPCSGCPQKRGPACGSLWE